MLHVEESRNAFRVLVGQSETDELVEEEMGG
jgi:hypothetical protein